MQELTVPLDSASRTPLYEQIYRFVVSEIRSGRIREGDRLPGKRTLCAHLGVSLSTVETAYSLLQAEGYIASRPRSGFYAAASSLPMTPPPEAAPQPAAHRPSAAPKAPRLDTSTSAVDTSAFPYATWARIFKRVLYDHPDLLQRGDAQGDPELREALSAFLYQYRGVRSTPEQIVVGAGLTGLLEMILHITAPNAPVALEDPGYGAPYRLLRRMGRAARPIPVDGEGMRIGALCQSDAALCYLTPAHQFPTGALMPVGRRMQLLAWAQEAPDRFLIEDDYDSEFRYSSRPIPALQGLGGDRVIYAGTFSRTIAPSIRVAYMVLPEALLARYRAEYAASASPVSRFEQQTLARFLREGFYARHLRRVGSLYRARCAALTAALSAIDGVSVLANDAGLHVLITHARLSEGELIARAASRGIRLSGLSGYCHQAAPAPSTVVCGFAGLTDAQVPELAALLAQAWAD